ncbi:MAG: MBOAT family protein [Bacteroidaceae bacterium]|nr:MBOAT family protein [Bacteroidaceae bacterium]
MLFNSLHFLLFFPTVCAIYYLLPFLKLRNLFLLIASYYFYMNWEPVYALLLLSSTIITYLAAIGLSMKKCKKRKKLILVFSLIINLAVLFLFKYYNFVAENLTSLLTNLGVAIQMPNFELLLPVGISFYIFQALGYLIDVYKGKTLVERNFFTYALFVSFFPQLVAGPIERSTNLLHQFKVKHTFSYDNIMSGICMMLWGYFLKLVLADRCALYVNIIFNNVAFHNGGSFLLASLFFPFQIYGDFAGYSMVAIGVAKILGFNLMENFRRPYFATTVSEFWHRWHISLSTWFKDYLYIPLGGNRVGMLRGYLNIMITFIVSGIWHGANWTFVIWGTIHGVLQCIEKFLGWNKIKWNGINRIIHWALTFCVVCLAWIFFRANTMGDAMYIMKRIFTDIAMPYMRVADFLAIALALLIVFFKELLDEYGSKIRISDSPIWIVRHFYIAVMVAFIILLGVLNGDQFIYFQF